MRRSAAAARPAAPFHDVADAARTVCIFEDDDRFEALASAVSGLGYRVADGRDGVADDAIAALVSARFDPDLSIAGKLASTCRVILVTEEAGFEFRLAAARAGVEATLSPPLDLIVLGAWLEDYGETEARTLSVLVVDDDPIAAETYAHALNAGGLAAHVVNDPALALEAVARIDPDLVLLDMQMPKADGMEIARIIRQSRRYLSLPIVFLSVERDAGRQRQARRIGGDDFISKPVDLDRLVSQVKMRAERAVALRQVMERDSLTGLLNHARFKERLALELERARRSGARLSACLVDIDRFKQVNDTYGHQIGDRVIQTLAHALAGGLRKVDVIARYGGEEFGILLLDTPPTAAEAVMNKLRRRFAEIPFKADDEVFSVTLSAGIAGAIATDGVDTLIAKADAALYDAKHSGRDRIVIADRK